MYCCEKEGKAVNIIISSGAERILKTLGNAGFEAYIVGGAVRDNIMGKIPSDYDIATNALPRQIKALFPKTIDTGIKHGTVTVIDNKIGYEITTFRKEDKYIDNRHPDNVNFVSDIETDLKRRDFTMNAIAYNPVRGVVDIFGGIEDIKNKTIRCVGDSSERFKEDALRMIRAVRFSACLNFEIDEETKKSIRKYSVLIKNISAERILSELNTILLCDYPSRMKILYETGLMRYIIPELCVCFNTAQNNKYHIYNVGDHIMNAVENTPNDLIIRWAALLHDVGKPACICKDQNGIFHFYGHHRESVRMADDILHRLRMDRESIAGILTLIENHDVRIDSHPASVKRVLARTGEELFLKLLLLQEADNRAKNQKFLDDKLARLQSIYSQYLRIIAEGQPYMVSHLAINGKDMIKMGYRAGREIGDVLKILLDEVVIDPSLNTREYLVKRVKNLRKKRD